MPSRNLLNNRFDKSGGLCYYRQARDNLELETHPEEGRERPVEPPATCDFRWCQFRQGV